MNNCRRRICSLYNKPFWIIILYRESNVINPSINMFNFIRINIKRK